MRKAAGRRKYPDGRTENCLRSVRPEATRRLWQRGFALSKLLRYILANNPYYSKSKELYGNPKQVAPARLSLPSPWDDGFSDEKVNLPRPTMAASCRLPRGPAPSGEHEREGEKVGGGEREPFKISAHARMVSPIGKERMRSLARPTECIEHFSEGTKRAVNVDRPEICPEHAVGSCHMMCARLSNWKCKALRRSCI